MKRWLFLLSVVLLFMFILESQWLTSFHRSASAQTNQEKKPGPGPLQDYVGRYEVDPNVAENFIFDVILEKGELWIKPSHIDKRKLVSQSRDAFVVDDMDIPVKFNRDAKGNIESLTIQTSMMFEGKSVSPRKLVLPPPSVKGNTTFRLKGYADAHVVALAGTFNNWNQSQLLFAREADEWQCRIDLAPGKYTYKFIIDGNWILDPSNPTTEDDERGFTNSVLVVKA